MRRKTTLILVGAFVSVLTACGSSSTTHGSSMGSMTGSASEKNAPVVTGAEEIAVTSESYRFTPRIIRVSAGTDVTLVLTSTDIPHDITIEGGDHIVHAGSDKVARGGLKIAKPGTYAIYCSVRGHRAAGMTGKVIVS
ncbi:MAG: cupredoxin domain-containing protein [Acidimicrobiia bacterium]